MTTNFDEIENKIIAVLEDFLQKVEPNLGDKAWTKIIKERIGELGKEYQYNVAIGGFPNKYDREWLYDIVWYEEDNENRLTTIPLIVESEWAKDYKSIKYDFEKLLIGNAERRLMICQCKPHRIEDLFDKFKKAINTFKENEGDRFLIAILNCDTEEFIYKTFTKQKQLEVIS